MRAPKITTFVIILLAVILVPGVKGQGETNLEVFAPIPVEQRPRLAERLKLFMQYVRAEQYDKLFDLFPRAHPRHAESTKELFLAGIHKYGKSHIVDFLPAYTREKLPPDGRYEIIGCAKEVDKGRVRWRQATTFVSIEDGEWYLSDLVFSWAGFQEREPIRCTKNGKLK